jgi:hypothetical protein
MGTETSRRHVGKMFIINRSLISKFTSLQDVNELLSTSTRELQ